LFLLAGRKARLFVGTKQREKQMKVTNFAPMASCIDIETDCGDHICIFKDEDGKINVSVETIDGTRHDVVLGEESETTKL